MNTFLTLLTGGGLVAAGAALSALVNNWLGSKRDERTRAHERARGPLPSLLRHPRRSLRWHRPWIAAR
jgi:hypothetical protein